MVKGPKEPPATSLWLMNKRNSSGEGLSGKARNVLERQQLLNK